MNYVDTSIVVSALDRSDPARSKGATALLASSSSKVVSELFLVELASAISRKQELVEAVGADGAKPQTRIIAYLVYLMSKFDLKLVGSSGDRVFTPMGKVGAEAGASLGLAAELKLRSLDLLHVAHLLSLKEKGYAIEAMLSSDKEFQRAERLLAGRGVKLIFR